jgi:hypothetical protein
MACRIDHKNCRRLRRFVLGQGHNIGSMSKDLSIQLDINVGMFTMAVHPGYQYLGRIQRGLEVGALALTPQGTYVQVNGSIVTPLNASRVTSSLRKLMGRRGASLPGVRPAGEVAGDLAEAEETYTAPAAPSAPVTVIVRKKKRTLVMPG